MGPLIFGNSHLCRRKTWSSCGRVFLGIKLLLENCSDLGLSRDCSGEITGCIQERYMYTYIIYVHIDGLSYKVELSGVPSRGSSQNPLTKGAPAGTRYVEVALGVTANHRLQNPSLLYLEVQS